MKFLTSRVSWGILLIAGGVLFLLQNLEILPESTPMWTVIFGAFGLYFLAIFISSGNNWWTAFPAFTLLGLAATIYVAELSQLNDAWAGVIFLGMVGLSFIAIYLRNRDHWWPLIPGGALLSLAGVVVITTTNYATNELVPTVLFGGLALTFLILYIAPSKADKARWAIWPAAGLVTLALIVSASAYDLAEFIFPIILIIVGIAVLLRSFQKK
jgi:hypothetical protein